MGICQMKRVLLYIGTLVWIIRGGETDGENGSSQKFKGQKMTYQWSDTKTTEAENTEQAKKILCNLGAKRSSCILCYKQQAEYTAMFTVKRRVARVMKDLQMVTLYRDVSYDNTTYTVVCETKIEKLMESSDKKRSFKVSGTCKKHSTVFLQVSACGRDKKRNGKDKIWTDACTINCSDHLFIRNPCSEKPEVTVTSQWTKDVTQSLQWTSTATHVSHRSTTLSPPSLGNNNTGIIVGSVGGVLGGVLITVVVVILWWTCRKKRSCDTQAGTGEGDQRISSRQAPGINTNSTGVSGVLPDVIKMSAMQMTDYANVYEELLDEGDVNQKSHHICDTNGVYIELKDEELSGVGMSSHEKACSRPLPSPFPKAQEDVPQNTYHRLGTHSETTQAPDRNDLCGRNEAINETSSQVQPVEYIVLEENQQDQGTYNKLRDHSEAAGQRWDTYNKTGGLSGMQEKGDKAKSLVEYFVLEDVTSEEEERT